MKYSLNKLSNGLRVMTIPMPSLESATLTVWVKTGSRFEEKKISGISHFLEHMVFKGSKKRPSAKAISELVDAIGGEFNAATSKEWTNFYIKARVGNLETAFDVLSDMVINPLLLSSEIEKEKGTIIQEIAMYEDTPMIHIGDVFEELIYDGNSLGWDTIGSIKTVRGIKRNDFVRYRDIHYHTDNILVTVAGGVTENQALSLAKKYFNTLESSKSVTEPEKFEVIQSKPQVRLNIKKGEQTHLILGFITEGRGYKNRFAQGVLSAIFGPGMSSRLFIEVRERRGLAYAVHPSLDRYNEVGYFGTYAGVDLKKVDEAIKVMLDQFYGLVNGKYPIKKEELTKAKEYIKGHLALSLESTNAVSGFFGEQELFLPQVLTPEEMFDKIDEVAIGEVMDEAKKLFVPSKLNLAIIGPYKDKEKFEKLLR
jgi:predicted Zn-dependent peptidase